MCMLLGRACSNFDCLCKPMTKNTRLARRGVMCVCVCVSVQINDSSPAAQVPYLSSSPCR